jgi:RES domain-containing protein
MILGPVGPTAIYHRSLTPRWATQPKSGKGAAIGGGRFNRPGVETRYLSTDTDTALAEYRQDNMLTPPATLVICQVTLDRVADFSAGYNPEDWELLWEDWDCNWRELWVRDKIEPPSWLIGDAVRAEGVKGILFPTTKHPGGTNLAVYAELLTPDDRIEVHDPDSRLPRDQSSWDPPGS